MLRVLACGGRDFRDTHLVNTILSYVHRTRGIDCLISGAARGADTLAARWANDNDVEVELYPALWGLHGRKAGMVRNERMLWEGKPDLVVAFPGGKGTANMVELATRQGVMVLVATYPKPTN